MAVRVFRATAARGRTFASFPFVENEYHYRILLGFGDRCECLGPPHIRAEMGRMAHSIAALYGGR